MQKTSFEFKPAARNTFDTELMVSAIRGDYDRVLNLIEAGNDVNESSDDGFTALIWAAAYGHSRIVRLLIQSGANRDAKTVHGDSALTFARLKGYAEIADTLERGTPVSRNTEKQIFSASIGV